MCSKRYYKYLLSLCMQLTELFKKTIYEYFIIIYCIFIYINLYIIYYRIEKKTVITAYYDYTGKKYF